MTLRCEDPLNWNCDGTRLSGRSQCDVVTLCRSLPSSPSSVSDWPRPLPPLPVWQVSNPRSKRDESVIESSSFEPVFLFSTSMVTSSCIYWCHFVPSFYLIAFFDSSDPLCHTLSAFSGALVLVLKKWTKKKSGSRAVTVKCCRSPCDLEHRNNNCTFSIFIFASS